MTRPGDGSEREFTHFVLTRFNVRNFYHKSEPTDEWLRERLRLFRIFCLPSLASQTCRSFTWLVFFDSQTPIWMRREIDELADGIFEPVFVEGAFDNDFLASYMADRVTSRYLITTRVDNDDAVASDFVETIQSSFECQRLEFVNLVNGAQYARRRVYLRPYTKNPFMSLVERVDETLPRTIYVDHHYRIETQGPIRNVRTAHPMWLQVIHEGNVLNEVVGLRTRASRVAPHFGCQITVEDTTAGLVLERSTGAIRICWRLVTKPARMVELGRSIHAKRLAPKVG